MFRYFCFGMNFISPFQIPFLLPVKEGETIDFEIKFGKIEEDFSKAPYSGFLNRIAGEKFLLEVRDEFKVFIQNRNLIIIERLENFDLKHLYLLISGINNRLSSLIKLN